MRYFLFFLLLVVFCVLETTWLNIISIGNVKPDLLLAGVIIAGLTFELRWVILFALFAGVLKDIFSLGSLGLNTVMFPLWGILVFKLSRKIFLEDNLTRVLLALGIVFLSNFAVSLVSFFSGYPVPPGLFFRISLMESCYTALFFPLVYKMVNP